MFGSRGLYAGSDGSSNGGFGRLALTTVFVSPPAPRRKTRSGPPGCAWRSDTLDAPLAYRHQGQDPLGVERDHLVGLRHGLEQLVQAPRQPSSICHRCRQLTTLHLLFMVQYQLVSYFLSTHVLRSTARAHPTAPCAFSSARRLNHLMAYGAPGVSGDGSR